MRLFVVVVVALVVFVGCGGNENSHDAKEAGERGSTREETRFVTQIATVAEPAPSRTTTEPVAEGAESENESPADVLALQYEYINNGDFEKAYSLFAEPSRQQVSLEQYRAFFEANAPYSVADYSFSPARIQGDSAAVDVEFTANSASGTERLNRTQEFVREDGDWRVLMRPEQVAVFTATDDEADAEPSSASPEEEPQNEEEGGSSAGISLAGSGQTATEPFELESGLAIFRMTHQGNRNFIVYLLDTNGARVGTSLANEIGSFSGSKAIQIPRDGTYLLQVEADGSWTIQVDQ